MILPQKAIQLPLTKTVYQTYVPQGSSSGMCVENPSIRNWYLNEIFILQCNKRFTQGTYSSPIISIKRTNVEGCPYLECEKVSLKYIGKHLHSVIRNMIDAGYYIQIGNLDDYYVRGKSWSNEWHFAHNGMIFGYDQNNLTYDMYSYDKRWIIRPYTVFQKDIEKGFQSCAGIDRYGILFAMKPKKTYIELNPHRILKTMKEYLHSTMENDPPNKGNTAYGIVVHEYLALYLDRLYDESFPHERMDRRSFRMIWEHKLIMLERLIAVEKKFGWDDNISSRYQPIVQTSNTLRMMYASHFIKPRKQVLLTIKEKLLKMKALEESILLEFIKQLEKELNSTGETIDDIRT